MPTTLEQSSLEAAATMRRAYSSFNHELSEFGHAAQSGYSTQMDTARRLAHEHMDAYLDAIASAHAIGRKDAK